MVLADLAPVLIIKRFTNQLPSVYVYHFSFFLNPRPISSSTDIYCIIMLFVFFRHYKAIEKKLTFLYLYIFKNI